MVSAHISFRFCSNAERKDNMWDNWHKPIPQCLEITFAQHIKNNLQSGVKATWHCWLRVSHPEVNPSTDQKIYESLTACYTTCRTKWTNLVYLVTTKKVVCFMVNVEQLVGVKRYIVIEKVQQMP